MSWILSFAFSVLFLALGVFAAVKMRKSIRSDIVNPLNTLIVGVFISASALFVPIYVNVFAAEHSAVSKVLKICLLSFHNSLRLFILDGDFTIITDYINQDDGWIYYFYTCLAAILFVTAPVLTFGVVLTLFKNISANLNYMLRRFAPVFVLSELNEKSIVLAEDLYNNDKKRLIVFTDVTESSDEYSGELLKRAEKIGAIIFKNDITGVNFFRHSKNSPINFFVIVSDESENIKQVLCLINKYKDRSDTCVYVFSDDLSTEMLLNSIDKGKIKIRRIQEVQSLISRNIYDDGYKKIFESAIPMQNGLKNINAVVVGMGLHGTEMTKTLSWVGQMDGYRLQITSFDKDKNAESKFKALCPELLDPKYNTGIFDENDACYKIRVNSDVDVASQQFYDRLDDLGEISYVFVSLGSDEMNIKTAVNIRSYLLRRGNKPVIDTVVFNSDKKNYLNGITNHSKQPYDINFIGDLKSSYCEAVVVGTAIERSALARHMKWGSEEEFWNYEYNYRSSVASAIHKKLKEECEISGIKKLPDERNETERENIRKLEHRRWNAYMRSEGYVYAETRNNLAKTNNLIKRFDELPLKEQIKDDD